MLFDVLQIITSARTLSRVPRWRDRLCGLVRLFSMMPKGWQATTAAAGTWSRVVVRRVRMHGVHVHYLSVCVHVLLYARGYRGREVDGLRGLTAGTTVGPGCETPGTILARRRGIHSSVSGRLAAWFQHCSRRKLLRAKSFPVGRKLVRGLDTTSCKICVKARRH